MTASLTTTDMSVSEMEEELDIPPCSSTSVGIIVGQIIIIEFKFKFQRMD
jgi:hypothetical protein